MYALHLADNIQVQVNAFKLNYIDHIYNIIQFALNGE